MLLIWFLYTKEKTYKTFLHNKCLLICSVIFNAFCFYSQNVYKNQNIKNKHWMHWIDLCWQNCFQFSLTYSESKKECHIIYLGYVLPVCVCLCAATDVPLERPGSRLCCPVSQASRATRRHRKTRTRCSHADLTLLIRILSHSYSFAHFWWETTRPLDRIFKPLFLWIRCWIYSLP